MWPAVGTSSPALSRRKVVLPAPLGPTRATTRLLGIRTEQPRKAQVDPKRLPSPLASMTLFKAPPLPSTRRHPAAEHPRLQRDGRHRQAQLPAFPASFP